MQQSIAQIVVEPDTFRVARHAVLIATLEAALAVCVHDDTQGAGGLLHLRYVATRRDEPVDLTDNTLSSNLLLMDRFCKELRVLGVRKQSWRVGVLGHTPEAVAMVAPAATVIDLVKAYYADSRWPVQCKEIRRAAGLIVHFHTREGRLLVGGADPVVSEAVAGSQTRDRQL